MKVRVDVVCSAARRTRVSSRQEIGAIGDQCSAGDVVVGRVVRIGLHGIIEAIDGSERPLSVGDVSAVVLGRRYSTAEFHGDIPRRLQSGELFDLLNIGGVAGRVTPELSAVQGPTVFSYLGHAVDGAGNKITTFDDPICVGTGGKGPAVVLVVGSSMDSGKTTTAALLVRLLAERGFTVGGAKLTGTSRMKDLIKMKKAGARDIVDFLDAGWPSTCGVTAADLERINDALMGWFAGQGADVVVMEVADGVFQRETEIILSSQPIMGGVSMIVACAADSVSAYGMISWLERVHGIVPDFISGIITSLPLFRMELSARADIPFFTDSDVTGKRCAELISQRSDGVR